MEVVFEKIVKKYGDFTAVQEMSLTIKDGSLHFLLGPSGCGKTTSLRMLAGLETPTSGKILFDGKGVTKLPSADRGIGMVFQNYALWPHMTVRKNIEYGLKLRKLSKQEIDERVQDVLKITQLDRFAERSPGQLSGGQQQRVALARALAIRPNVLLLDEPLSNLDAKLRLEMRDNITRIHKKTGITTVYVTHDQKEALSMGTAVSVMHGGQLIQTDSPRDLYLTPNNPFIAGFIGEANLVDGEVKGRDGDSWVVGTTMGDWVAGRHCGEFKVGDSVALSIRPEAIRLANDGNSMNEKSAKVLDSMYLGETEQLTLDISGQTLRTSLFHASWNLVNAGDSIQIMADSRDVLMLASDSRLGQGT